MKTERKLATIRRVDAIETIPNADAIEVAVVGGWRVVVKRNEYKSGDLACYLEIDSWVPTALASFLSKGKEPKEYNGISGERLRSIKLRGVISQGLLLPLDMIPLDKPFLIENEDITEVLGIQKWEPKLPAELAGQVEGLFPAYLIKTAQERCQNLKAEIFGYDDRVVTYEGDGMIHHRVQPARASRNTQYEVTIKMDGTSFTGFYVGNQNRDNPSGVCSRNYELKINEENAGNSLVRMYVDSGMQSALAALGKRGKNIAVSGELMGQGIQGNREGFQNFKLFVFDILDADTGLYLGSIERTKLLEELYYLGMDRTMVQPVPVLHDSVRLTELNIYTIDDLLAYAEGPSLNHKYREGLVFKRLDGQFSFKVISQSWLLRYES